MRRRLLAAVSVIAIGIVVTLPFGWTGISVVGRLLFGWASYLVRVLRRMTISWDGVVTALVCLVLFTLGLHVFLRWFHREVQQNAEPTGPHGLRWSARRTVYIVSMVIVMFVAGIAATGVAHQVGWLVRSPEPLTAIRPVRPAALLWEAPNFNLRMIGLAIFNYNSSHERLPTGKRDPKGRPLHSWQTAILPFLGARIAGPIDEDRPWNDPRNSAYFRGIVVGYLNPEIESIRSAEGYALSHYAGNRHVLGTRKALPMPSLPGGLANTILAGEVARGFKPWGDPSNLRDPLLGTSGTSENFGNPSGTGAEFLFGDGSVRFLSRTTSPGVLGRFGVPNRNPSELPKPDPATENGSRGVPAVAR